MQEVDAGMLLLPSSGLNLDEAEDMISQPKIISFTDRITKTEGINDIGCKSGLSSQETRLLGIIYY